MKQDPYPDRCEFEEFVVADQARLLEKSAASREKVMQLLGHFMECPRCRWVRSEIEKTELEE